MPGIGITRECVPFSGGAGYNLDAPSGLTLTVINDTTIKLDWIDNTTIEDGFLIERSTDGINYVQINSVLAGIVTYTDNTLAMNTRYYYRVRAYKMTSYSPYCTAANDYTAFKLILAASGTGAGVTTIRGIQCNAPNLTMTIDGNGHFYTDSGGTLGESQSTTITSGGMRTFYLKVTSGNSNLLIFQKNNLTHFNNGSYAKWWENPVNAPVISTFDTANLPRSLQYFYHEGTGFTASTGNVNTLPTGMIIAYISMTGCTFTGNIALLPSTMTAFQCKGSNTLYGDIHDIPSGITIWVVTGNNHVDTYTSGRVWNNNINYFWHRPAVSYGLSSTEVDNLLIDLAVATWAGAGRTIELAGNNAPRTAASDAARTTLIGKSVSVTTN